jgi:hypothetical protein
MTRRKLLQMIGLAAVVAAIPLSKPETDKEYYRRKRLENPIFGADGPWVSYRFRYTVILPPNNKWAGRIRFVDSVKAIA